MQAVGQKTFGGPEVLQAFDLELPSLEAGEVRVKVAFAGVNAIDVHMRTGNFLGHAPAPLAVLGYEGAGEVSAVGPGVVGLSPGDRVAWCAVPGSHATQIVVPAWRLVPVPAEMPLDIACALQLDGALAHALAVSAFPVRQGDWLMIQGATSVASQVLIQIARAQGGQVIASVPGDDQGRLAKAAGADHVLGDAGTTRIAERVLALTGGQGCNAVFDGLGRPSIASSLACCRRRGAVVLFGTPPEATGPLAPEDLAAAGSLFVTRVHLPDYLQDETEVRWRTKELFGAWLGGQLKVGIGRVLPLAEAVEAHRAVESGAVAGKVLLKMA